MTVFMTGLTVLMGLLSHVCVVLSRSFVIVVGVSGHTGPNLAQRRRMRCVQVGASLGSKACRDMRT